MLKKLKVRKLVKRGYRALKCEGIKDLVTQQAGVVQSDNAIHIRGGRSYENAFY
jgi:hypothetical protein